MIVLLLSVSLVGSAGIVGRVRVDRLRGEGISVRGRVRLRIR